MERQNSRRRRPPPTQEPEPSSSRVVTPQQQQPRPLVTWSLIACLLIVSACLLRPDISLRSWTSLSQQHRHGSVEAAAIRPRIELHPEDHAYRSPGTRYLDWRVTAGQRRPDGVLKQIYLINDMFPGPTIEARSGDTLIITVTNDLPEDSITLHWHGLHVANAMDGAAGVSQCPISPGVQFVYKVTIPSDQSGTFWYHAHSGISRADGLYGGLVVHAPVSRFTVRGLLPRSRDDAHRFGYEKELLLLIGDWYHQPARDVLAWYMTPGNFGNEPVPDSLLINGVGHFDCPMAVPARPVDCIDQPVSASFLDLEPDTAYRIRVVNTGALAGLSLAFDHEQLDLVQVDSVDVARYEQTEVNSAGILFPGQRMDFVLRPPLQTVSSSSMTVQLDQGCFKYINPALTPDQTFPIDYRAPSASQDANTSPRNKHNKINLEYVPSAPSILKNLPPQAQETHVVYTKIQKLARNHNVPFGYFNQTTWKPQQDPPIPLIALPRNRWDSNQFALTTGPNPVWVDLVVNNLDEGPHPFHLHGHHFYILTTQQSTYGWGAYNPFEDPVPPGLEPPSHSTAESESDSQGTASVTDDDPALFQPYDLSRASLRDTVQIPSRGYAVLRFRADNPGVWLFHCHILWHLATGMAMLIDVRGDPLGQAGHDLSLFSAKGGGSSVSWN